MREIRARRRAQRAPLPERLEDLRNVGPSIAGDLRLIGIERPAQLAGRDPYQLYDALCTATGVRHDPCVIDTFIAIVRFADGGPARPWWHFTPERKRFLAQHPARHERGG